MPHSFGYRARTRKLFSKGFKEAGMPNLSTYLTNYRLGDIVDIKANSAVHKGMPHKVYHGRTGTVWNVTPRAVGVVVNKRVNTRIEHKKIHLRVEHVSHSKCRLDFLNRVKQNELNRTAAKKNNTKAVLKRIPKLPKKAQTVKSSKTTLETISPAPYELIV